VIVFMKSAYGFGKDGVPGRVPPFSDVVFDFEIVNVECKCISCDLISLYLCFICHFISSFVDLFLIAAFFVSCLKNLF